MKKTILMSVWMMATLCLVGCGGLGERDAGIELLAPNQESKVNEMGWNLLKVSLGEGRDNIAISPASIRGAFCPLQYGLGGNTQKEVDHVMGDGVVFDRFISQYNKVNNGTKFANRLIVDKTIPLHEAFMKAVPKDLLGSADFSGNPSRECVKTNDWIEKNTNGLIKHMLPLNVFTDPNLNEIYFS